MTITHEEAVAILLRLFHNEELTFRSIAKLKDAFDEAVIACNQERINEEADYYDGRKGMPNLASKDTEDDFYAAIEHKVQDKLGSDTDASAIADMIIDAAEYSVRDFYLDE